MKATKSLLLLLIFFVFLSVFFYYYYYLWFLYYFKCMELLVLVDRRVDDRRAPMALTENAGWR